MRVEDVNKKINDYKALIVHYDMLLKFSLDMEVRRFIIVNKKHTQNRIKELDEFRFNMELDDSYEEALSEN